MQSHVASFLTSIGLFSFPALLALVPLYAWARGLPVYETFVRGASEGLRLTADTLPYLIAIFAAITCFRHSGILEFLQKAAAPLIRATGIPPDVFQLILLRPLSGSGSLAVASELIARYGPDSSLGILASLLQGATDTTFYVVTLYFGVVRINASRRALVASLVGDLCGFTAAYLIWRTMG